MSSGLIVTLMEVVLSGTFKATQPVTFQRVGSRGKRITVEQAGVRFARSEQCSENTSS